MITLTITRPDDWHLHVRDGAAMGDVIAHTAKRFARAIIMPNLKPPVTTTAMAVVYRERILKALPADSKFEPLMTLYLTDSTSPEEISKAKASGIIHGIKLYPAGTTTHSDMGITDIRKCSAVLETMAEMGMPLLVHGEVADTAVDIFDREKVFIERVLTALVKRLPQLKIVFEHITTHAAVEFVLSASHNIAATITPQHLLHNRNALFQGGLRPHYYCLPVLKCEHDREALVRAATSGNPKFFLGTDSAPHPRRMKEAGCGCAGMFTAHAAIELYAEIFEDAGALDKLEGFSSVHGADFYGLPRNREKIILCKQAWSVPASYPFDGSEVVPYRADETVRWSLK